jgi:heterodisulfide reductase subunit B2
MTAQELINISYFPGCSLATTAKENNQSLIEVCRGMGYSLVELDDWNCCGSSSAHSIKSEIGFQLSCRNLSLAQKGIPLLVACPSCILHLKQAQNRLKRDEAAREEYEYRWNRPVDLDLEIIHFFELLAAKRNLLPDLPLNGLKFVPYYGCMLARPPELRHEKNYYGLLEKLLSSYGASPITWSYSSRCCGTFLSVAKPEVAEPMVNQIIQNAVDCGAECIVTACAMCHLNLEIRCTLKKKIPIFHFSEILSLAYKTKTQKEWFSRHLIDPMPLLKSRSLVS